jgi:superfamily II DNA or RNA helicase
MYDLRDYQSVGIDQLYEKIRQGKRKIIYWIPTGTGKGLVMSHLVNDVASTGKGTVTIMRRRDLIFQTQENYKKYHRIHASIIMGNSKGYDSLNFNQICSIDTIRARMLIDGYEHLRHKRVYIVDECHDANSPTYQRFFKWVLEVNHDAIFVGFTATPFTIGGKPLGFWDDYVQPLKASEACERGYLMPDLHYAPEAKINTAGLKLQDGDYKEKDLFDRAKDSVLVGDIVSTWLKIAEDRPTILYCINKDHSMMMTAAFNMRGIPAIHVDESSTQEERKAAVQGLKRSIGKYKVMCNIETMTTGVDAPWVECIDWARPTWSEVLYVQGNGRGARPYKICADCGFEYGAEKQCGKCKSTLVSYEKKNFIILDHATNAERHGFTYDDRKARLFALLTDEEKKRSGKGGPKKVENPVTMCEKCFVYTRPGQPCPKCLEVKHNVELPKTEAGELKLIDEATATKLRLNQLLSQYEYLRRKADIQRRPVSGVYFTLHNQHGDIIFQSPFKEKLGVPDWVEKEVRKRDWEKQQKEIYEKQGGE